MERLNCPRMHWESMTGETNRRDHENPAGLRRRWVLPLTGKTCKCGRNMQRSTDRSQSLVVENRVSETTIHLKLFTA